MNDVAPTHCFHNISTSTPTRTQGIIQSLIHRQHTAMPQPTREPRPRTRAPPAITRHIPRLIRPVPVLAVEVQQHVRLARDLVVPVARRALDAALDDRGRPARASPRAEQPRGRDLDEDGLERLVLEEAHEGLAVGARRQDVEVDDVGGGFVDVGRGRGEGLEVGGVGVADHDGARGAGVVRV